MSRGLTARSRKFLLGTAFAALLMAVGASTAGASPEPGGAEFAAQARTLGLDVAGAKALQAKVDGYLAQAGGTQVAANQIHWKGADLYVTIPGEIRGRALAAPAQTDGVAAAPPYLHMYAYSSPNYTGDVKDLYYCAPYGIPWVGTGSWINNQRTGDVFSRAFFQDNNGVTRWTSPVPYSSDSHADWNWVHYVQPCSL